MVTATIPRDAVECVILLETGFKHMKHKEWESAFNCNIEAFTKLVYICQGYIMSGYAYDYYLSHFYNTNQDQVEKMCIACLDNISAICTASSELVIYTSIVLDAFLIYYKYLTLRSPSVVVNMVTRYYYTQPVGERISLATHYVQDANQTIERIDELCLMLDDEETKHWDWFVDKYV